MTKSNVAWIGPSIDNRTVTANQLVAARVMPWRRPNAALRPREHLTEREVDKLIEAAKGNRWGLRDSTMLLIAFRHGLRVSELVGLQWSDVEFEAATIHIRKAQRRDNNDAPLAG